MTLEERELALERECLGAGKSLYRERLSRLRSKGLESMTDPVSHLLRIYVKPVADALTDWIAEAESKPCKRATASYKLSGADPDVCALLALKTVLNALSRARSYQSLAVQIGAAIELELRLETFETANAPLYATIQEHVAKSPLGYRPDYRTKVLKHAMNRYKIVWESWDTPTKLHVGAVLLDLMIEKTGLLEQNRVTGKRVNDVRVVVSATQTALEWLEENHLKCEGLHPQRMPMLVPPNDFTSVRDGGYLLKPLRVPLVRSRASTVAEITAAAMPSVFAAVNALQKTAWEVQDRVLDTVLALWDAGSDIPGCAARTTIPLPLKPHDIETNKEARALYKLKSREVFLANEGAKGRRMATIQTLAIAKRMRGETIYFPHFCDFRGRMYCCVNFLTPQGSDLSKGLLRFATKVPLGKDGYDWLLMHAANCFGVDKVSIEERRQWARDNFGKILQVARDPLDNRWWAEADSPIQFLAVCLELGDCYSHGNNETFLSSLPVMVDGSCNGIQHLAALSADEVAGKMVNLVPSDKPADIYAAVAERTIAKLSTSTEEYAQQWLNYGVDRSTCKRPTMIRPYGGTLSAVEEYVGDSVTERMLEVPPRPHPFGSRRDSACRFLAKIVWESINEIVTGPAELMRWTKAVVKEANKVKKPLVWTAPTGFVVHQSYPETTSRRVKTRIGDKVVRLSLREETDALDTRRQSQSAAPNWIHSLDAAALAFTICIMLELGHTSFAAVHDSYGTHAGNMSELAYQLRETFISMYREDLARKWADDIGRFAGVQPPPPPPRGSLNIEDVRNSPYFFA